VAELPGLNACFNALQRLLPPLGPGFILKGQRQAHQRWHADRSGLTVAFWPVTSRITITWVHEIWWPGLDQGALLFSS